MSDLHTREAQGFAGGNTGSEPASDRYRHFVQMAAAVVAVIGIVVLSGWALNIEILKRLAPDFVAMNPATAVAFILAAAGLWLANSELAGFWRRGAIVCAALAGAIGLLKLLSFAGIDARIDQILFHDRLGGAEGEHPNRMAPNTAVCFVLLAGSLLCLDRRLCRSPRLSQALAGSAATVALLAIIGYAYSATSFYGVSSFIPMALHTAVGFLVLALGSLAVRPHEGFMSLLTSATSGGLLMRRLLPAIIMVPPFLGWLRLSGEQAGLFTAETGLSLLVTATILLFLIMIWWTANQLRHSDAARASAECTLREREQLLRSIISNSTCAIYVKDSRGRYTLANRPFASIVGMAPEEMIGRNDRELFPPPLAGELESVDGEVLACGHHAKFEQIIPHEDGERTYLSIKFPLLNEHGEPAALCGISTDITERKNAEAANARLASIIEHTHDAVYSEDLEGRITSWNRGAESLFGYTADEVIGRPVSLLVPPELPDEIPQLLERLVRGEQIEHYETVRITKCGERRQVSLTLSPIKADTGEIVGASKIARDITDRKEAEEQLARAKALAEDASRMKSEFLANMSHEIRTPMMAIIGYADLLLDVNQNTSDRLNSVNVIRRNAGHLLTIINDILDLSKIESGELQVEEIPCSPCQVVYEVVSLMRVRAAEKNLEFRTRLDGQIPETIHSDPTRLRQILINLVGNAIKFTESGWVKLHIRLIERDEERGEPMLRFDVIDTGIGMSKQQMANLFKPFGQADASTTRQFGGTGLGLAISRRLAGALGGEIEVDSSPGRGSTFSVLIRTGPLDDVKLISDCREAITASEPTDEQREEEISLEGRILLAEDGVDNRQLLAQYLRLAGAEVTEAENGRVACNKAIEAMRCGHPFDLVVLDMQMPELDGYGAASKLRASGYDRPIVALTAHAMAEDREKCLKAGCTDYLSKPLSREMLIRTLALHLGSPAPPAEEGSEEKAKDSGECLFSDLTDEAIMPYLNAFIDSMPSKTRELEALVNEQDATSLVEAIHQVKGSGGLFGFHAISEKAAEVEELLQRDRPWAVIAKEIEQLVGIMARTSKAAEGDRPSQPQRKK